MGSATSQALAAARRTLGEQVARADLATAEELFQAARAFGGSAPLRSAIADPATPAEARAQIVNRLFSGQVSAGTLAVLDAVARQRWSQQEDVPAALEELGIRVAGASAGEDGPVEGELFAVLQAVGSNAELELALRNKLAEPAAKAALVDALLAGKASEQTVAIVRQLVLQPRGRSIRTSLRHAAELVADEAGKVIATVTVARGIDDARRERLQASLSAQYGRDVKVNLRVDPAILGGVRVQIGDDVIDSSVAARLQDLRLELAG